VLVSRAIRRAPTLPLSKPRERRPASRHPLLSSYADFPLDLAGSGSRATTSFGHLSPRRLPLPCDACPSGGVCSVRALDSAFLLRSGFFFSPLTSVTEASFTRGSSLYFLVPPMDRSTFCLKIGRFSALTCDVPLARCLRRGPDVMTVRPGSPPFQAWPFSDFYISCAWLPPSDPRR